MVGRVTFRMERMENSIQDLIAVLNPAARSQTRTNASSFQAPQPTAIIPEEETDDDDDDITRPTAVGTDESEEGMSRFKISD